jgi:molybdate transport system substrate-binding protein
LVERAEAPLGLVYATDAAISKKVRVVGTFPVESHPPIVYPVAAVAGQQTDAAAEFLDFLKTPEARAVFEKYGFEVK